VGFAVDEAEVVFRGACPAREAAESSADTVQPRDTVQPSDTARPSDAVQPNEEVWQ